MSKKTYSKLSQIKCESAPDTVVDGCMVLEGGAFRGMYTAGVLDALMREGINLQCTVGVSAGAANGVSYVAGQTGRSALAGLGFRNDSRYVGFKAILKAKSVVDFDFAMNRLPGCKLDYERLNDPKRRLIAVACNIKTGEVDYLEKGKCESLTKAVQASGSLPYASRPVRVDGNRYLDGGSRVKLAYPWALENGFEKIVVVRTRPLDWRYKKTKKSLAARIFYCFHPKFAKSLSDTHQRYNDECDELDKLSAEGRVFVIAPSRLIPVSRLEKDVEKLGELYELGVADGEAAVNNLKKYLEID